MERKRNNMGNRQTMAKMCVVSILLQYRGDVKKGCTKERVFYLTNRK